LHSDSRNPCLTSYVNKGCGCRCFRARFNHNSGWYQAVSKLPDGFVNLR
jgi:hypothetical protein